MNTETTRRPETTEIVRLRPSPEVRSWCEKHGFSPELVERWVRFHPRPEALLESLLHPVPRYLRVNSLRQQASRVVPALEERGFSLVRVPAPSEDFATFRVQSEPFALASTPEHLMGDLYVQDLASLSAPAALRAEPGDAVLDMAAAPGGKTTAIAQLTGDRAPTLAVEPVPHRAAALSANLRRLGVTSVGVRLARGEELPLHHRFDRILLDAPCTGEGVLPRDANRRTGDLGEHAKLATLQRRLMDRAVQLLEPGGILVYSACTFSPEECEGVVQYAVEAGLVPEPLPFAELGGVPLDPALSSAGPLEFGESVRHARRAYPDRHNTLGFFVARLRRPLDDAPSPRTREGVTVNESSKGKGKDKNKAQVDGKSGVLSQSPADEGVEVEA